MAPDPKRPPRAVDRAAWKQALLREPWCVVCDERAAQSAHHILKRSQGGDDVAANLVGVCGDGTRGCHGLLEAEVREIRRSLGRYILRERVDFLEYLGEKLVTEQPRDWIRRRLLV